MYSNKVDGANSDIYDDLKLQKHHSKHKKIV